MNDEARDKAEIYTGWLQEWVKGLPGPIKIVHSPVARTTPYRWTIYRGDPPAKVGLLHPDSAFLVGLQPGEAHHFLQQVLTVKLM